MMGEKEEEGAISVPFERSRIESNNSFPRVKEGEKESPAPAQKKDWAVAVEEIKALVNRGGKKKGTSLGERARKKECAVARRSQESDTSHEPE